MSRRDAALLGTGALVGAVVSAAAGRRAAPRGGGAPDAAPAPLDRAELEANVKFVHPEKLLANFAGLASLDEAAVAALYGTDLATYRAIRRSFADAVGRAAGELLDESGFAGSVDRLPFTRGDVIVALGDSITDDYGSWAYMLAAVLERRRGEDRLRVVNAGVSGNTTADVISRFVDVAGLRPDWIVTMIGTNDARRHGVQATKVLIGHEESGRNLAEIRRLATTATAARLAWMTPATVIEARIERSPRFAPYEITMRNDDLAAKAGLVGALPDPVVDLQAAFGRPAPAELMDEDGLHPGLDGQKAILRALVERLASG